MVDYTALVTKWGTLVGTTQAKLDQVNTLTIAAPAQKAVLSPSRILNACVFADLATFTQLQVSQLTLLLAGTSVDVSAGSTIRAGIVALFAGKTQSLANMAALVAPFDSPTQLWLTAPVAEGGAGLTGTVDNNVLVAAGGLS